MTSLSSTKAARAADAWRRIFDCTVSTVGHRNRVLAYLELIRPASELRLTAARWQLLWPT